jgi:hypothetical protein
MAVTLTVTLEPARQAARLEVDGLPAPTDTFTITRTAPSGNVAAVRGAVGVPVTGPTMIVRDYELPFDLPVVYAVTVYDGADVVAEASATFEIVWDGCEAWLVDLAHPTNSLPLVVESIKELDFGIAAGVHRVLNRRAPVLTTLPAWTPSTELIVLTDTLTERDQVRALYGSGYPFLLRTSPELGVGNLYLGLTEFVEERFLSPGAAPERRFRAACVQVERPDPALYVPLAPNTYANVAALYASYADLLAAVGTYDQLAYTFPDNPDYEPLPPWLPDDV